ncbi:MAG TPA: glycosyltransferase family 39 protein [Gaiellaceae bacterium]|nr:glycosyltransferase family 39 protein [Gaiellaceae bacterium]
MARSLRRTALIVALPALVGASLLLHWLAARTVAGLWIMPDEAIYGLRALRLWHHGKLALFGQSGAGYSVLYPVLAGGPLSIGPLSTGYALLKPVQALVMSLAAVPVYLYVRRTAGPAHGLLAASLTLAAPVVLFSGYVMTEVLYYPLATAALLAIARAVETARYRDQVVALVFIAASVLTRVQAIVLLAVFVAAVLADAALRDRRRPARFWLVWAPLVAGAAAVAFRPSVLGAYATTVSRGYDLGDGLGLSYDHLAYLILIVGVVPAAALVLQLVDVVRGRADSSVRALALVTLWATVLVVPQVGFFGSRYAPHLLERDLAALLPLYFAAFALWLARGAPRPVLASSLTAIGLLAVLVLAPWNTIVNWDAFPDSPGISLLLQSPGDWRPLTAVCVLAAVLLVLFRFAPFIEGVALLILALFAWTSAKAAHLVADYSRGAQSVLVGTPRNWIDHDADRPVAYVYNGDLAGTPVVYEQRFWNNRITGVVSLTPNVVAGPIRQTRARPQFDGGLPITQPYAVANDTITLRGSEVAQQDRGPNQYPLVLWRLEPPARLATGTAGVLPNGDMTGPATVVVYDCAGGSLNLTLLSKSTRRLVIDLNRRPIVSTDISGEPSWHASLPVPRSHGPLPCRFTIRGDGLLGSTQISFAYPG